MRNQEGTEKKEPKKFFETEEDKAELEEMRRMEQSSKEMDPSAPRSPLDYRTIKKPQSASNQKPVDLADYAEPIGKWNIPEDEVNVWAKVTAKQKEADPEEKPIGKWNS